MRATRLARRCPLGTGCARSPASRAPEYNRPRLPALTLPRLFVLTTLAAAIAVAVQFSVFWRSSRATILARSAEQREAAARRVEARVASELRAPEMALEDLERAMRFGALSADDPVAVEARLFSELLDYPTLSDITLTRAAGTAFMWQLSVFRASADPASEVLTRRITRAGGVLLGELRRRPRGATLLGAPFEREPTTPPDPTAHATYEVTVAASNYGRAIWSDLSYSELDAALPQPERRVVLTVQKAVEDTPGHLVGVVRVGLLARTIDAVPRMGVDDVDPGGPERVLLCDPRGRLLARLDPSDAVAPSGDDLRVVPTHVPAEIAAALAEPGRSDPVDVGGKRWLVTYRALAHTQDWWVGVLVPEDYYVRDLRALRDRFLVGLAAATGLLLLAGGYFLRQVRRSLARVVDATTRMRRFDFAPLPSSAALREVADVMEGVERAKTSMRALGKYVPVDLVRELYAANREPELGGDLVDLSLMFTDIEGFTGLAERLPPDALAEALGRYLEAMTAGVRSTDGTVDKFIGDAVMAFWNAPRRAHDHAARALRAALACSKATRALYGSPAWAGLPPLVTRFGLHTARVMVGHFGAPERLSYTALGDGVNLAARLEGLCKHYGVMVLASEAIVKAGGDGLSFRLVDRVAVKGKHESVRVYELLERPTAETRAYEAALEAYFARDFTRARELFRAHEERDPPSQVMAARCEAMITRPPPDGWDGVYVATSK
jgi:adenylate cyclase